MGKQCNSIASKSYENKIGEDVEHIDRKKKRYWTLKAEMVMRGEIGRKGDMVWIKQTEGYIKM